MKKDVQELYSAFEDALNEIRHDRKTQNEANSELSKYKVKVGTLNSVLLDSNNLTELSQTVLCLLSTVLYDLTRNEKINPETFFNPVEIVKSKQYAGELKEKIEFPIVIENVIRVGSSFDYVTTMSIQDIKKWNDEILNYNYETQRTAKKTRRNDGTTNQRPEVKMKSVKQISELILKGKFKPDTITLNVLLDGNDDIVYDEKNFTLTINSCTQIDILDGFHRILGMSDALETNSDIELYMNVAIKNYSIEDARFYFGQINTVNPVGKARIKELKNERISDMIVTELSKKSELNGKIASKNSISSKVGELTNFTIMSDAIEEIFKPQNKKDMLDITPFLIDFFDYLIGSYPEAFVTQVSNTKESSWINHQNVFVGYIVLAKRFMDSGKSVSHIKAILNKIDFNKETSPLSDILLTQRKVNSNRIKKSISEFFGQIEI